MKTTLLALALGTTWLSSFAEQTPVTLNTESAQFEKDIYPRWSVVGDWKATHPVWADVITFRKDGTMVTMDAGTTGRWVLTADEGTPLLVLRWDAYGTESLMMVGQDHFRGQISPGSFIDMRRGPAVSE